MTKGHEKPKKGSRRIRKAQSNGDPYDKPDSAPAKIPIDGLLDLHTFSPQEVKSVVEEYLQACHDQGIYEVRIIHGKGTGVLRRTVHALLERNSLVLSFRIDSGPSSWGATLVYLMKDRS